MQPEEDWRLLGACRGVAPKTFIPDDTGDRHLTGSAHERALKICARCPVTEECLEHALKEGENWGVWGNTTPRQRRSIREKRAARVR